MTRPVKEQMIKELTARYRNINNWVMVNYRGLKAKQAADLRNHLRGQSIQMNVVKNSVIRFSFKELGWNEGTKLVEGPSALIYSESGGKSDNPIDLPKAVMTWRNKNLEAAKSLVFRGGYVDKRFVSAAEVTQLSRLPSREVLFGQVAGTFKAPITKLAVAISSLPQKLALLLKALSNKKK